VDGAVCRLAVLADRAHKRGLGLDPGPLLMDALHRSMLLWKEEKRKDLVRYLGERDFLEDLPAAPGEGTAQAGGPFWKLAQALFEVLPRGLEDWKLVSALLGERQTLRAAGKRKAFEGAEKRLL
jgi:hypothetical protein